MSVFSTGIAGFSYLSYSSTHLLSSYELQVSPSVQGGGIGKTLLGILYEIAQQWNMQKIVLTVLHGENAFFGLDHTQNLYSTENEVAFSLYKTMGLVQFIVDICSANYLHEVMKLRRKEWIMPLCRSR